MAAPVRGAQLWSFLDWVVACSSVPQILRLYSLLSGDLYSGGSTTCIPLTTFSAMLQTMYRTLHNNCFYATVAFSSLAAYVASLTLCMCQTLVCALCIFVPGHTLGGFFALKCTLGFFVLGCALSILLQSLNYHFFDLCYWIYRWW
jgi:hypothetical protein